MLQQLSLHFFPSRRRLGERGTEMCLSTRSAGWQTVWWQSPQPPPARSSAAEGTPSSLTRFPNSLHLLLCPLGCPSKQPCSSGECRRHHHLTFQSVPPSPHLAVSAPCFPFPLLEIKEWNRALLAFPFPKQISFLCCFSIVNECAKASLTEP